MTDEIHRLLDQAARGLVMAAHAIDATLPHWDELTSEQQRMAPAIIREAVERGVIALPTSPADEPVDVLPDWPRAGKVDEQLAHASTFEQVAEQLADTLLGSVFDTRAWAGSFVRRCAEIRGDDIHTIASERLASRIRKARRQRDSARRELAKMTDSRDIERGARKANDQRITELERQFTQEVIDYNRLADRYNKLIEDFNRLADTAHRQHAEKIASVRAKLTPSEQP